ncbi:MAG: hypothetical protein K6T37_08655 [Acidothermus cellulolyticus]|nr:hypothetical protein [Acidothermus cellulolyticus]
MRLYVPFTVSALKRRWQGMESELVGPGTVVHGVTPALREWYVEGDDEDLEYAAMTEAAAAAVHLVVAELNAGLPGPAGRVVLSVDLPDREVEHLPDLGMTALGTRVAVHASDVAALHADEAAADPELRRLAAAIREETDDAPALLEQIVDRDLLWYAPSEVDRIGAGYADGL